MTLHSYARPGAKNDPRDWGILGKYRESKLHPLKEECERAVHDFLRGPWFYNLCCANPGYKLHLHISMTYGCSWRYNDNLHAIIERKLQTLEYCDGVRLCPLNYGQGTIWVQRRASAVHAAEAQQGVDSLVSHFSKAPLFWSAIAAWGYQEFYEENVR